MKVFSREKDEMKGWKFRRRNKNTTTTNVYIHISNVYEKKALKMKYSENNHFT